MMRWWLTPVVLLLAGVGFAQEPEADENNSPARSLLDSARELFRKGDYQAAEPLFRRIANHPDEFNPQTEEARYCQAECLRLQRNYPQAARVYAKALQEYPFGTLR